jgi:hypothetical protein
MKLIKLPEVNQHLPATVVREILCISRSLLAKTQIDEKNLVSLDEFIIILEHQASKQFSDEVLWTNKPGRLLLSTSVRQETSNMLMKMDFGAKNE